MRKFTFSRFAERMLSQQGVQTMQDMRSRRMKRREEG